METAAHTTRRDFLLRTAATAAAASLAGIVPDRAHGGESTPPSEQITLGVIGIGPRCTYDLKAMLQFSDVRCVAIADVQAERRDAGKALVDGHYGNSDCVLYRDFR
ncbi:MAG: twin-arginine translocation signal domain-containing protein, partial [Planctomycetaceae bacterium]